MTDQEYEQYVKRLVAQAPPLTAVQTAKLGALFDNDTPEGSEYDST
jgi:hypothetical protein